MKKPTGYILFCVGCVLIAVLFVIKQKKNDSEFQVYNLSGVIQFQIGKDSLANKTKIVGMNIFQGGCFYTNISVGEAKFIFNGKEFSLEDSLQVKKINFKEKDVVITVIFSNKSKFGKIKEVAIKDRIY